MLAAEWSEEASPQAVQERGRSGGKAGGRGRRKDSDDSLQVTSTRKLPKPCETQTTPTSWQKAAEQFRALERKVRNATELKADIIRTSALLSNSPRSPGMILQQTRRRRAWTISPSCARFGIN